MANSDAILKSPVCCQPRDFGGTDMDRNGSSTYVKNSAQHGEALRAVGLRDSNHEPRYNKRTLSPVLKNREPRCNKARTWLAQHVRGRGGHEPRRAPGVVRKALHHHKLRHEVALLEVNRGRVGIDLNFVEGLQLAQVVAADAADAAGNAVGALALRVNAQGGHRHLDGRTRAS
eukprot:1177220-Prorocentrum_minimum.AAC.5